MGLPPPSIHRVEASQNLHLENVPAVRTRTATAPVTCHLSAAAEDDKVTHARTEARAILAVSTEEPVPRVRRARGEGHRNEYSDQNHECTSASRHLCSPCVHVSAVTHLFSGEPRYRKQLVSPYIGNTSCRTLDCSYGYLIESNPFASPPTTRLGSRSTTQPVRASPWHRRCAHLGTRRCPTLRSFQLPVQVAVGKTPLVRRVQKSPGQSNRAAT